SQELVEAAYQVERREHSDRLEALGRLEIHVTRKGLRHGGAHDEPDNGNPRLRRLGAAGSGRRPCRDSGCRTRASPRRDGSTEHFLLWNNANRSRCPSQNRHPIISYADCGDLSVCDFALGCKFRRPNFCPSPGKETLAENGENGVRRLTCPVSKAYESSRIERLRFSSVSQT